MSRFDSDMDYADWLDGPYGSCEDCGRATDSVLCEECADLRDTHTSAIELRMATAALPARQVPEHHIPVVVDVALVPVSPNRYHPVVAVALVPIAERDARDLKRMAKAILSADLTRIQEVA